ncbi:hypothetical protein HAALTHF_30290n [Vreelandella aquamarina]|nr:hypothetical protein HAALTHF_30290n [Halomonas axialensis]
MAWYHQWASFAKRLAHVVAKPMKRDSGRSGMMVHPYRGYGSQREIFVMGRVFRQAALGRAILGGACCVIRPMWPGVFSVVGCPVPK